MIITLKYKTLLSINELNKLIHDLETYDSMIVESVNTNENIITVKLNKTCTVDYLHELQILHDIRFYLNVNDGEDDNNKMIDVYQLTINDKTCIHAEIPEIECDLETFLYDAELGKMMNDISKMKINEIKEYSNNFIKIRIKYLEMPMDEYKNLPEFGGW